MGCKISDLILIAGNDLRVREGLTSALSGKYGVLCAENTEGALKIINGRGDGIFCIVVCMTTDECRAFLNAVRTVELAKYIPIIALSDNRDDDTENEMLKAGAMSVINKNQNPDIVITSVENAYTHLNNYKSLDRVRRHGELFRIVTERCGMEILRYDIKKDTAYIYTGSGDTEARYNFSRNAALTGSVAESSVTDVDKFFASVRDGSGTVTADFMINDGNRKKWLRYTSTPLAPGFPEAPYGETPAEAIISVSDCTEAREREMAYIKWQQEIGELDESKIALYEWNLSKDCMDKARGKLVTAYNSLTHDTFNKRTEYYSSKFVFTDDVPLYTELLNRGNLIDMYMRKKYSASLDYRVTALDGSLIWRRISVQLVPYPDTEDIKAYILTRDIDSEKRRELDLKNRSERDSLTGVYNRATFVDSVKSRVDSFPESGFALLMVDIDGFKRVNDTFGHTAGDRILVEYSDYMRTVLSVSDVIGRIGGDEFMICIPDTTDEDTIYEKADNLCTVMSRELEGKVKLTVSMGIAMYPFDGTDFDTLYKNSDTALYYAKNTGKSHYTRYDRHMKSGESLVSAIDSGAVPPYDYDNSLFTVLITDDNIINRSLIREAISKEGYNIKEAKNGEEALRVMRSEKIDIHILDIIMPGIDSYTVMEEMRNDTALCGIPVIISSSRDDEDARVKAFEMGAAEYITKPYSGHYIKSRIKNVADGIKNRYLSIERSEREHTIELQRQALLKSERDSLTGLFNRSTFMREAALTLAESNGSGYLLACLDIDNFKVINDRHGVETGDKLLRHVSEAFRAFCTQTGGIIGRDSADSFVCLIPQKNITRTELEETIRRAEMMSAPRVTVKISIGYYVINDFSLSVPAMLDRASLAKATIKGLYDKHIARYNESMREDVLRQQRIVENMDEALKNNQFEIWYQPQYDIKAQKQTGAEALVRWRHPEKGIICPGEFIPVFERNGFIYELDKFVWCGVCSFLSERISKGKPVLPISVNVSRYDVFRKDFFDFVCKLPERYNIPKELIRFEITESAFNVSSEHIIETVDRLRKNGFIVEIDDFGSGYSSLNILKDVPVDILKLDMRFIESNGLVNRGGRILESVIRMTKWLDMTLIAEGVESIQQAEYLSTLGCTLAQGYFYAKPMTREDYEKLSGDIETDCGGTRKNTPYVGTDTFWNPNSLETMVFNRFCGSAGVIEYVNGHFEMLRVNEKFTESFRTWLPEKEILKREPFSDMSVQERERIKNAFERAEKSREPEEIEVYSTLYADNGSQGEYVRCFLRLISSDGERSLFYVYTENITDEREASEQLRFLNKTASMLLTDDDTDIAIKKVLYASLEHFDGDRAYVFEYNDALDVYDNTYEVCAENITAEIDNLKNVPAEDLSVWTEALRSSDNFVIEDVDTLGESRAHEREVLSAQGIKSLFVVPMRAGGKLIGFIGVDNPSANLRHIDKLAALGDYVSVSINRRNLNKKLKKDNDKLLEMMYDMPGGFARMRIYPEDKKLTTEYLNEEFCSMLGMSHAEAYSHYMNDAMYGVHPDDVKSGWEKIMGSLRDGFMFEAYIRMMNANGIYVRLRGTYRISADSDGFFHLNGYYMKYII